MHGKVEIQKSNKLIFKGAVSWAKLENYKMPVKLRET